MAEKEGTLGLSIKVTIDTAAIESAVASAVSPEIQKALEKATRELKAVSGQMAKNIMRGIPETTEPEIEKPPKKKEKPKKEAEEKPPQKPEIRSWFALFTKSGKMEVLFLRLLKGRGKQVMILKELLFMLGLGYLSLSVMSKYSAVWASTLKLIQLDIGLFLKPIFDILGALLLPVAVALLKMAVIPFNKWVVPLVKWLLTDPYGKKVAQILGTLLSILLTLMVIKVLVGTNTVFGSIVSSFTSLGAILKNLATNLSILLTYGSFSTEQKIARFLEASTASAAGTAGGIGAGEGAGAATATGVAGAIGGAPAPIDIGGIIINPEKFKEIIEKVFEFFNIPFKLPFAPTETGVSGVQPLLTGVFGLGSIFREQERVANNVSTSLTELFQNIFGIEYRPQQATVTRNINVDVSVDLSGSMDEIVDAVARELRNKLSDEITSRG